MILFARGSINFDDDECAVIVLLCTWLWSRGSLLQVAYTWFGCPVVIGANLERLVFRKCKPHAGLLTHLDPR